MQKNPLVSIIVRTKDRPELLLGALSSIAAQTYRPLEVVLVNDGGGELDIENIKGVLADITLNYIKLEKNSGRAHAGNTGISGAKGIYIGFLDDDDELSPDHIEGLVSYLDQGQCRVAYAGTEMVFQNTRDEDIGRTVFSRDFSYEDLLTGNYIPFNSVLFHKETLREAGGLDESFELYEDWDLLIRVGEKNPFHHIDKITARYLQWSREQQINRTDENKITQAYLRIISKHLTKIRPENIVRLAFKKAELENELNKDRQTAALMIRDRDEEIQRLGQLPAELERLSREKDLRITDLEDTIKEARETIIRLEDTVRGKNLLLSQAESTISIMKNTLGWRALETLRGQREKLLPPGKARRRAYDLAVKSIRVISTEGTDAFLRKARRKIKEGGYAADTATIAPESPAGKKDILFVSGCPGDAFRYRCIHQLEEAEKQGLTGATAFHGKTDMLASLPLYLFFILHRVPIDSHVSAFIEAAETSGKIVIFDTDDLVFDESFAEFVHALKTMDQAEKNLYHDGLKRYRSTLLLCKYATTTTEFLAGEISKLGLSVHINRNAVSGEMVSLAKEALSDPAPHRDGRVVIGYLSGTPTHNADFACAAGALIKMLDQFDFVDLLVVGHLTLPEAFSRYGERVLRKPLMPWQELPKLITLLDINIAPLEKNPFCESKSELKFLEAGLLKVPTVASNVGGFRTALRHGINGFLAEEEADWVESLTALIKDPELRRKTGEEAYNYVMENSTTTAVGKNLTGILKSIRQTRIKRDRLSIGWVLQAPFKGSGGYTTIFRTIAFLRQFGHDLTVYIDPIAHFSGKKDVEITAYTEEYFPSGGRLVVGHEKIGPHDVLIATGWPTAYTVMKERWAHRKIYFVQDHEPDFYNPGDADYKLSLDTYSLGLTCLSIGPYLAKMLNETYGASTGYFDFSVDPAAYFPPSDGDENVRRPRRIIFYARPETKRRGFEMGIKALNKVHKKYPDTEILMYGSSNLKDHKIPFPYKDLGIVSAAELGERYRSSDIGLSISMTNLSLVPLEMMACGCIVVEINSPRCEGTLKHRENSLLAEPDEKSIAAAICELIEAPKLFEKVRSEGMAFAAGRTHEKAARQFEALLIKEIDKNIL